MNRLPAWAFLTIGTAATLLALMGITNSVHTSAKIVYAFLLAAGIASLINGYRKRKAAVK
jgi:hypothetical protein